jgi:hypothetical protein
MCITAPSMLLVTAEWNEANSFKLIPMSKDCPFSEGIFDLNTRVLALMSAQSKDSIHLVPRLDEDGELIRAKKKRQSGKTYQEQRVTIDTFVEYYVSVPKEIEDIVNRLAINAKEFDFQKYLVAPATVPTTNQDNKAPGSGE